jgi:cytochrome c oxidase subunit 4
MSQHIIAVRTYVTIFIALLVLLLAAIGIAYLDLRWANFPLTMAIATCKSLLIILYFMHARFSSRLTWIIAGAGFFWLAIMMTLTLADYLSRGWLDIPGK